MTLSGQVGFIKLFFDETTLFGMLALTKTLLALNNPRIGSAKSLHFDILADQIGQKQSFSLLFYKQSNNICLFSKQNMTKRSPFNTESALKGVKAANFITHKLIYCRLNVHKQGIWSAILAKKPCGLFARAPSDFHANT